MAQFKSGTNPKLAGLSPKKSRFYSPYSYIKKKKLKLPKTQEEVEKELMDHEMQIASDIQANFLPDRLPQLPGFELSAYYKPCNNIGGDYYDFMELDKNKMGILIADVSGHGIPAALVMVATHAIAHVKAPEVTRPAHLMKVINDFLSGQVPRGMFVTAEYGIIDLTTRSITLTSCGHNPAVLWRNKTATCHYINPNGLALGITKGAVFEKTLKEATVTLNMGDKVVLYTDGIIETMDDKHEMYGMKRMLSKIKETAAKSCSDTITAILDDVKDFAKNDTQADDITMVAIRCISDESTPFPAIG